MTRDPQGLLDRKLALAKLALLWEALWRDAFPALMIVGVVALAVLTGVLALLPGVAKLVLLAGAGLGLAWSLRPLLWLRLPDDAAALRRLETQSNLKHRPATAWRDDLADPDAGEDSRALWHAHRARMAAMLTNLKAGVPRSPLPRRDPYALRSALVLGLVAAFVLNASQWRNRITDAVALEPRQALAAGGGLDAWIVPPSYTGRAPVLLTGGAAERRLERDGEVVVPEQSLLVVRLNGAEAPRLALARPLEDGSAGDEIATAEFTSAGPGVHATETVLDRPVNIRLTDGSLELAEWTVAVIPDGPPTAEITGAMEITATGAFMVPWEASDDYGVASLGGSIELSDEAGLGDNALPYDPPEFSVNLPRLNPREAEGRAFQDLTEHPWAGLEAVIRLEATDQARQSGYSAPVAFTLPERRFRQALARSLVELRQRLVRAPDESRKIVRALAALLAWPEGLIEKSGHHLGIRAAANQLHEADGVDDKKEVVDLLWEIALSVEDGDLSDALRELQSLRQQLQEALAEGAPPEQIAELMDQLREALNRYLEAMARQMQQAMERGELQPQQGTGQEMRTQDLERMLDMIENMARSGARDAAQELLAQLDNILRNLQPGMAGEMGDSPMGEMMEQLGEMMREQQRLMDETFQMPDGMDGMQPQEGEGQEQGEGLAGDQEALARMLEDLMAQLGEQGMQSPQSFGQAQGSMEGAADSLRGSQRDPALAQQGDALEALREGAQAMAQQMMQQQGQGEGNQQGARGEPRGGQRDPLGRPTPQRGEDYGPDRNMLPTESAVERAREILEYLRSRANERNRPPIERDYIDRLLRGLY
ncbi:MAG TPA: TIGR02302 family protein [Aestuariivirgaceae bacterium]|nr:TIGR02302 family protein [Aestuariivirgaceae bacterium]